MYSRRESTTRRAPLLLTATAAFALTAGCAGMIEVKQAKDARQRGDCAAAVPLYEKVTAAKPKDAESAKALEEARLCASNNAIAEGKKARAAGDLKTALEQFQRSIGFKPTDEAKTLAEETKAEQQKIGDEVAKAEQELSAGHLEDAKSKAEPLIKYAPAFPSLKAVVQNATSRIQARALAANGKAKLDAGEVEGALKLFEDALRLDAGNEVAGAGRRESRKRYALGLKAQGDAYAKDHRRGKALQSYSLALPFADDDPESATKIVNAVSALRRDLQEAVLRRAEIARKAKLPGAEWAWLTVLTRLQIPAADRLPIPPIPDLELSLAYPVSVQVTGAFAAASAAREELIGKLRGSDLPLSVQLQPYEGAPVGATLVVEDSAAAG